jgi:hypothetical protein
VANANAQSVSKEQKHGSLIISKSQKHVGQHIKQMKASEAL